MTEINPMSEFEAYVPESREAEGFIYDVEAYARACAPQPPSLIRRAGHRLLGYFLDDIPAFLATCTPYGTGELYTTESEDLN